MTGLSEGSPRLDELRREMMRTPDEVAAMLRLKALGWGVRRIAAAFGCSQMTVRGRLDGLPDTPAPEGIGRAGGLAGRAQ